jgi:predicted phage-related endonuclease
MTADTVERGLTAEQHAARAEGVGASEAAAACGLSERMSMAELWAIKTGRAERPGDDDENANVLRLGNAIEPFIIDEYARATGTKQIIAKPDTLRRDRQIAHLDALTPAAVVEAKWRGTRDGWGEPRSSDIPAEVLCQVVQQMDLAERPLAHVPVLFMRPPIAIYEVEFDAELASLLREGVARFWWHVENEKAPTVNPNAPRALEALRAIYKGTDGTRIQADTKLEGWRKMLENATDLKGQYERSADLAKAHLLRAMGPSAELQFIDGSLLRRKLVKRKGYSVAESEYIDARLVKAKE